MALKVLYILILISNFFDDLTTYLALTSKPAPGHVIVEANPIARVLFETIGLVPGLVFEFFLTVVLLYWVMKSTALPHKLKVGMFVAIFVITTWAVLNNTAILQSGAIISG